AGHVGFMHQNNVLVFGNADGDSVWTGPTCMYLTSTGDLHLSGNVYAHGSGVYLGSGGSTGFFAVNNAAYIQWQNAWRNWMDNNTGHLRWNDWNYQELMRLEAGGTFWLQSSAAYKAGGGAWIDYSDDRVKRNVAEYKSGL